MTTETILMQIPVDQIVESKTNPRQHFDEKGLGDLVESIKVKGIIVPLLLRPVNNHFEIIAGARRFRAAKAVGLQDVPAVVRKMTDAEAEEIRVIENLQREGVHPLDEAEGYKRLLDTKRYDVAALAAKVGKSASYIHQRLALNTLIPAAKEELWKEGITLGHALLLAKLQPVDQKDLLHSDCNGSLRDLQEAIQRNVMCVLDATAFDKKDPLLVPKAGACTVCPKRTGFNKELFADIAKKDRCTDPACFAGKIEAHLTRVERQAAAKNIKLVRLSMENRYNCEKGLIPRASEWDSSSGGWRSAKKGCLDPKRGLMVQGGGIGRLLDVCTNSDCKSCNPKAERGGSYHSEKQKPGDRYKRRIEIWENKVAQETRNRLRTAVLPLIKGPVKRWHLLALLRETMDAAHSCSFEDTAKLVGLKWPDTRRGWDTDDIKEADKLLAKADDNQILRFIFAIATHRDMIHFPSFGRIDIELLTPLIAIHGGGKIDAKKIEAQVRKELDKKKPKPPKVKVQAKKTAKGKQPKKVKK